MPRRNVGKSCAGKFTINRLKKGNKIDKNCKFYLFLSKKVSKKQHFYPLFWACLSGRTHKPRKVKKRVKKGSKKSLNFHAFLLIITISHYLKPLQKVDFGGFLTVLSKFPSCSPKNPFWSILGQKQVKSGTFSIKKTYLEKSHFWAVFGNPDRKKVQKCSWYSEPFFVKNREKKLPESRFPGGPVFGPKTG